MIGLPPLSRSKGVGRQQHNSLIDYEEALTEITNMCVQYNAEHIWIVGDLNTDIRRSNSPHTLSLLQLIENEQSFLVLNFTDTHVKYTYYNLYLKTCSIMDHAIVSQFLYYQIQSYYTFCEDVDNMSNH